MAYRRRRDHVVPSATEEPTEKRYKVVGPFPVGGVKPGGYVTLKLTKAQARHLLTVGHVEEAPEPQASSAPAELPRWLSETTNRPNKAVDEQE